MRQTRWSRRLTFLGLGIGIGLPGLMRLTVAEGLVPARGTLTALAIGLGALCILGGYLAYRAAADQVQEDREEIGLDGGSPPGAGR